MTLSNFTVFILTFIAFGTIVVIFKRHKNSQKDVIIYSIGNKDFLIEEDNEHSVHGLLHVSQIVKKVHDDNDLTVVQVPFPKNGQDFIVMLVRTLNYNSIYTNEELMKSEKEDDNFWVLISDGAIGTNYVTLEINSYMDIDADIEFYGYKKEDPLPKDL
ncbi:unnamed protein product [Chironomus riparius]|uniref:Uncharacterized protein n=1 Tax=Chironomus riparius TaxID=315576 RepID=A0A9N9WMU3_9DIPT|nr:unnamed protein product [Chironomus riparius]